MQMTAEQSAHLAKVLAEMGPGPPNPSISWSARFDYMSYSLADQITRVEYVNSSISLLKTCEKGEIVGVQIGNMPTLIDTLLLDHQMRALLLARAEKLGIDLSS
jgi:hypothetical protein